MSHVTIRRLMTHSAGFRAPTPSTFASRLHLSFNTDVQSTANPTHNTRTVDSDLRARLIAELFSCGR
jgi:CubicO group peptidase (beta-lactamase class C family)